MSAMHKQFDENSAQTTFRLSPVSFRAPRSRMPKCHRLVIINKIEEKQLYNNDITVAFGKMMLHLFSLP
jgi:hypothetical protein